jgi:insertion element IS1 protein InsB
MVTITLHCPHCGSEALVRDGHAPNGKQKYPCHSCGRRSRENPTPNAYLPAQRRDSARLPRTRASCVASRAPLASLAPRCPVGSKKVAQLPPLRITLVLLEAEDAASTILELDELWPFVLKKANDSWIWIALCRKMRRVVAYAVGDRSKQTCQRLWEAIPEEYRLGHCFTDFLRVYASVIPEEQHTAVGPQDRRDRSCRAVE